MKLHRDKIFIVKPRDEKEILKINSELDIGFQGAMEHAESILSS